MSGGEAARRGSWGERLVAADLERRGFQIIARGYRSRFGEIDLAALNEQYLCFIEVKLRKSEAFAPAWAFVDRRKQEKLRVTAELFLAEHPQLQQQPRFDIAEVYAPQGTKTQNPEIVYWENAF